MGHTVVLHARNTARARDAEAACPGAAAVLIGDLTSLEETRKLAAAADATDPEKPFDAVLHNAGVYLGMERVPGKDGRASLFCVNTLAPYVLTCLMKRPKRLLFVSSGMHRGGHARVDDLLNSNYSDSKLQNVMLAKAFARHWTDVESNSADPGWVPTKMGGLSAPGDIESSIETFVMLALGQDAAEGKTGKYFYNSHESNPNPMADDVGLQDELLQGLEKISGISIPE
jgi:NAD(P)-dependent dehydrogenase (short-subunit alcohol dehydrogenase family)